MDGTGFVKALAVRTLVATTLVAGTVGTQAAIGSQRIVATVPNRYDCSRVSQQCWQTNPPHSASVINRCRWNDGSATAPHRAVATCDKHTAG